MLRSFYSGISGLRNFQTKLDVVSNNIANVNTVGFKKSRVVFQDIISQTLQGATAPDQRGGVNPKQVGLGASIATIDTIFDNGSPQTTNVSTDLYINGNGFFVVTDGNNNFYLTRAGNFTIDRDGNLVNSQGLFVVDSKGQPIKGYFADAVSYTIEQNGTIVKIDSNGETTYDVKIGISLVENPAALEKIGDSLYRLTSNADPDFPNVEATIGEPTVDGRGTIWSGFLEMSNVDLAEEFTEMIIAQRGFQANSRIITTSDEVLQELVNLKR